MNPAMLMLVAQVLLLHEMIAAAASFSSTITWSALLLQVFVLHNVIARYRMNAVCSSHVHCVVDIDIQ